MKKQILALSFGAVLLALCFSAMAQQPAKVRTDRLLLADSTASANRLGIEAFPQGLRDLGYVEGKNICHRVPLRRRKS